MINTIYELKKEKFEQWLLFGQHVLFTDIRINNDILPKNIYKYELQENDFHPFETIMIGKRIMINFEGTILSSQPIQLDKDYYRMINERSDIEYLVREPITLNQYINKKKRISKHNKKR